MNKYSSYSQEQLSELLSGYLIESWSYSKVSCFSRNEKQFEKNYVYAEPDKRGVSSIAGNAYHEALAAYFGSWDGSAPDILLLSQVAYEYLDEVPSNVWKLTDKLSTVDLAREDCTKKVNQLLQNFCAEYGTYTEHIAEVLSVEVKDEAWVTCNGVDIPLPLHFIADLVVRTKDGKTVVIDHKSKGIYTQDDEVHLVHGQQAITYVWAMSSQKKPMAEKLMKSGLSKTNTRRTKTAVHN